MLRLCEVIVKLFSLYCNILTSKTSFVMKTQILSLTLDFFRVKTV